MKLFAQHGAQEGEKVTEALNQELIDGVIYSPRDVSRNSLQTKLDNIAHDYPEAERLFDPQFYAVFLQNIADSRMGNLDREQYPYFENVRRPQLERDAIVRQHLRSALLFQESLNVSKLIAPNILIPSSLDSVEAVIAKNFIRLADEVRQEIGSNKQLLVTLAIGRDALLDEQELLQFLNEITLLDTPPHGFYLLISARRAEMRLDIFNAAVVARSMLLTYTLAVNGFEIVNGYSDIMSPFFGAVGSDAGAFGWFANTRNFSLDRFAPGSGGGRLPIQRYLSKALLNRITYFELDYLREHWPQVLNGLPCDSLYPFPGSEPPRNREVFQSWEAISSFNDDVLTADVNQALANCEAALNSAANNYAEVKHQMQLDTKSNDEHLDALKVGISEFKELAELD